MTMVWVGVHPMFKVETFFKTGKSVIFKLILRNVGTMLFRIEFSAYGRINFLSETALFPFCIGFLIKVIHIYLSIYLWGWVENLIGLKVDLMTSYRQVMNFLTDGIQALQQRLKKRVNRKVYYV